MEKAYERINWENYPNKKTKIDATNLNKMDSAIDEIDNRVIRMEPVNNLLATEPGKPLDATQGKVLGDKVDALGGFTPVIDETTGKITGYKTEIGGADTVFPFKGVTYCGSYTESGSFNIADYGLQNVAVENFIFVPSSFSSYNTEQATQKNSSVYTYFTARVIFDKATFALDNETGILDFTLARIRTRPMTGTNTSNATTPLTTAYISNYLPGDIYYLG